MGLLDPTPPPYDALEWAGKPFADKARLVCQSWALQGYGSPPTVLVLYGLKVFFYLWAWAAFVGFTPGLEGGLGALGSWWAEPIAFQKFILWSLLFEVLGLGCGSGP
ncbi:MAG: DUF3556 domain-containing protein, partial [Myxococcota bacterium]